MHLAVGPILYGPAQVAISTRITEAMANTQQIYGALPHFFGHYDWRIHLLCTLSASTEHTRMTGQVARDILCEPNLSDSPDAESGSPVQIQPILYHPISS
jgi:hypothetical protein